MSCERVERWLDDGRPVAGEAGAHAHAASCARCAAALRAALELDTLLAAPHARVSEALADRVMARVAVARRGVRVIEPPVFDWWVRAAAEPSAVLALALAALVMWRGNALPGMASQALAWLGSALPGAGAAVGAPLHLGPAAQAALSLALMLVAPWASWLLFRWSESIVRPHAA